MIIRDYNGKGAWSVEAVQSRYLEHCARLDVQLPRVLQPKTYHRADVTWVYPIMEPVIEGIKAGDPACATLGVEFIEQDGAFPFGRVLKSNAARALKGIELSQAIKVRIRRRVAGMLGAGNTPREFKEYARLLRKVGFEDLWPRMAASEPAGNKYAMRYFSYFRAIQERSPAVMARGR
ncbi:hypothetical protein [Lysobacter sp. CA196]|uniref:hypothetical protein n=1 Tax=Lysobacter sp. CA196 TaxID=3455606 RepID=UPI003F8D7E6F